MSIKLILHGAGLWTKQMRVNVTLLLQLGPSTIHQIKTYHSTDESNAHLVINLPETDKKGLLVDKFA
ncbi:hypothetical protein L3Y34_010604 [Caenorhabditis briggsae]|uniref:Uncharacterized protein n=1 Tax=Caenorhabditis briggsae TaxID=6238 RepID=A0AAE8ZPN7_CAEBR|nr:hypothetical protein L3Y34_010604 [Caenorhabditis briggsae]